MVRLDRNGRILGMNKGAERLFGYDQKEAAGESFLTLLAPASQAEATAALERLARGDVGPVAVARRRRARSRSAALFPGPDRPRPARQSAGARLFPAVDRPQGTQSGAARKQPALEEAEKTSARQDRAALARQPRDAHAAARHHGLRRGDLGGAVRTDRQRALSRLYQGHPRLGPACAVARQRPARYAEDRTRQDGPAIRADRRQRGDSRMRHAHAAAGGARAHHHAAVALRPVAERDGRRAFAEADHAQSDGERGQIQRARRPGDRLHRGRRRRRARSCGCATPASA